MSALKNPIAEISEATDAATKILTLQADLFLLKQEVKTLRQIRKAVFFGISLIFLNLTLIFTFYWLGMSLHEQGWSASSLMVLSFFIFGAFSVFAALYAIKIGQDPKGK